MTAKGHPHLTEAPKIGYISIEPLFKRYHYYQMSFARLFRNELKCIFSGCRGE